MYEQAGLVDTWASVLIMQWVVVVHVHLLSKDSYHQIADKDA